MKIRKKLKNIIIARHFILLNVFVVLNTFVVLFKSVLKRNSCIEGRIGIISF